MIVMKERLRSFGLGIRVLGCEFEDRWNSGKCGERRRVREGSGIMHTRNATLSFNWKWNRRRLLLAMQKWRLR